MEKQARINDTYIELNYSDEEEEEDIENAKNENMLNTQKTHFDSIGTEKLIKISNEDLNETTGSIRAKYSPLKDNLTIKSLDSNLFSK